VLLKCGTLLFILPGRQVKEQMINLSRPFTFNEILFAVYLSKVPK